MELDEYDYLERTVENPESKNIANGGSGGGDDGIVKSGEKDRSDSSKHNHDDKDKDDVDDDHHQSKRSRSGDESRDRESDWHMVLCKDKGKSIREFDFLSYDFRFSKDPWMFYVEPVPPSERVHHYCNSDEFEQNFGLIMPIVDDGVTIRHRSGIQFKFSGHDALFHWIGEKFGDRRFGKRSFLPSYQSPLEPSVFDSSYTGRILFQHRLGAKTLDIHPVWDEVIDWHTLSEQAVWTDKNSILSNRLKYNFQPILEPLGPERQIIGFTDPSVNSRARLLYGSPFVYNVDGRVYLQENLVVTDSGWFFCLRHVILNSDSGIQRVRDMRMHCSFNDDIIYREIIEMQSNDFEKNLLTIGVNQANVNMRIHYHEVRKLDIAGTIVRENCARMSRSISFTPAEMSKLSVEELELSDDKIGFILANFGPQIKLIEETTGSRIQVIPLFHFPRNPTVSAELTRFAYIYGSKSGVECAKSYLTELISRGGVNGIKDTPTEEGRSSLPPSNTRIC